MPFGRGDGNVDSTIRAIRRSSVRCPRRVSRESKASATLDNDTILWQARRQHTAMFVGEHSILLLLITNDPIFGIEPFNGNFSPLVAIERSGRNLDRGSIDNPR